MKTPFNMVEKVPIAELSGLMKKHLSDITESEFRSLAFILDFEVPKFWKSEGESGMVIFRLSQNGLTVEMDTSRGYRLISACRVNKGRRYKSVSWGGRFNFADAVWLFRNCYRGGATLTMQSPEKMAVYGKDEWFPLVLAAHEIVEAA